MLTCNSPLYSSSFFWNDGEAEMAVTYAPQVFIDRAPAYPDDPTIPALSFPTGGGPIQQWDVASQTWEGVVSGSAGPVTSGGTYALQVYIDRAPALPNDPTIPALSFPAGGGPMQQWTPATQTWD